MLTGMLDMTGWQIETRVTRVPLTLNTSRNTLIEVLLGYTSKTLCQKKMAVLIKISSRNIKHCSHLQADLLILLGTKSKR